MNEKKSKFSLGNGNLIFKKVYYKIYVIMFHFTLNSN